jgi:hypothetical protein
MAVYVMAFLFGTYQFYPLVSVLDITTPAELGGCNRVL